MLARLAPLLAAAALLVFAAPALADQYDVTATGDAGGTCTGGTPTWTCTTLRAAVADSNEHNGEDQIFLQAPGKYVVDSPLTLNDEVMLAGLGARETQIDGNGESQVLVVTAGSTASIFNLTIQNGSAPDGAGGNILNNGELSLLFTRITGGHAATGGGIASRQATRLTILSSLIDDNDADLGGGIDVFGTADPGPSQLDVSDSTFARNFSPNQGGAIRVDGAVLATISHATIAANTGGGGLAITNGAQADVELFGSLLADNLGNNCPSIAKPTDEQYNLDDQTSCLLDDDTSIVDTDPGLDEGLRDRGGQTDVLPFLADDSPAIDMVAFCGSGVDQRGFARVTSVDQPCDAGAYEESAQGPPGPTIDTGPSGVIAGGTATFEFSSDDPTATFVCRLSSGSSPGTFETCTSPKTYSGLGPGNYVFQVALADQSGQPASAVAFRQFSVGSPPPGAPIPSPAPAPTAAPSQVPTPVPQHDATGKVVQGKVLIKLPGGKFAAFDPSKPIPDGAEIDVTKGRIELTAVLKKGGKPEKATFYDGIFKLKLGKTTTDLVLSQPLAPCGKGKAGAAAKKPKTRKLWGNGSGSFRTRGQYSAATVRGTQWLVQDSCTGTLTKVTKGVVSVFDQVKKRTIVLRAGKSYLAKPRR
jgi:predicted outer membrane repeat protein